MNFFNKTTTILTTTEASGSVAFDSKVYMIAKLMIDIIKLELRLDFIRYEIKTDNTILNKKYISSYNVGTFRKPKKRLINTLLKEHNLKTRPFRSNGWKIDNKINLTSTDMFIELQKNLIINRIIKLSKIKKLLIKKRKK